MVGASGRGCFLSVRRQGLVVGVWARVLSLSATSGSGGWGVWARVLSSSATSGFGGWGVWARVLHIQCGVGVQNTKNQVTVWVCVLVGVVAYCKIG